MAGGRGGRDAAVGAWRELGGGPVALKLDAPGLAHKSDAGGVALGLADEASIAAAVEALLEAAARPVSWFAACSSSRWRRPASS